MRVGLTVLSLVLLFAQPAVAAPSVKAVGGNIVLLDKGASHQLTKSGHDSDPVLSPDGKLVVFFRATGGESLADCSGGLYEARRGELWSVSRDGRDARKLAGIHAAKDVRNSLCAFHDKQFSSDGRLLYFLTPAWATSDAVHVFDLTTGRERFVVDGNGLTVLARCTEPDYRDKLVVERHKYFAFGGSYDWLWLVDVSGKEIGPVGETDAQVKDACS
jgi:hypothetical protein